MRMINIPSLRQRFFTDRREMPSCRATAFILIKSGNFVGFIRQKYQKRH